MCIIMWAWPRVASPRTARVVHVEGILMVLLIVFVPDEVVVQVFGDRADRKCIVVGSVL